MVQIFPVIGQSSQGKGVFISGWCISIEMFLSSISFFFFFCKKNKKVETVPQFDLFLNVIAMPCVTIQGDLLLLDWCYTQWENMQCYAVCCTVFTTPYIRWVPLISYLSYFAIQTWAILLKYFMSFFKGSAHMTHAVFGSLFSEIKKAWDRELSLMERLRRWKAD